MKVLLVSVGGSDVPVVKAIEKNKADYVYFICSEDNGQVKNGSWRTVEGKISFAPKVCEKCKEKTVDVQKKSLVEQSGLRTGNYEILKVDCDKVYDVYEKVSQLIIAHIEKQDQVVVDYTGGTKSMSAGCVAAAMEHLECEMSFVAGERVDLIKVRDGQEIFQKVREVNKSFVRRQGELARHMFAQRDYKGATAVLEEICDQGIADKRQEKWLCLCRVLVNWDNFEWDQSPLLKNYKQQEVVKSLLGQLGLICSGFKWYKDWNNSNPNHNYAPVYDLLLNAERRADAGAYDDAMSRVYRAVEMYAQFALKNNKQALNTSDLRLELLPEVLHSHYEKWRAVDGKIKFGLETSYDLLADIEHPVGKVWGSKDNKGERKRVLDMMKKRNYSFLAHGIEPLTKDDWIQVKDVVWEFIHKADEAMELRMSLKDFKQLPNELTQFEF